MSDRYWPEIDESSIWPINTLRMLVIEDPQYLNYEDCPYPDAVKESLQMLLGATRPSTVTNDNTSLSLENLEEESEKLYHKLQEFGEFARTADASERNTYFRVSALLLERLIALKERILNLKQMHSFTKVVLQVMEDEVPPDIRTNIIDRLKAQVAA